MRLSNPLVRLPRTTPLSALELILLALVAVQGARLVWALLTPVGPVGDWKAPASFAAPTALGALGSFDPFFRLETGGSGVVTSLNLKLYGVREDRATGRGSAIIALPDGRQMSFAVGDEIMPGVTLAEVGFDSVTINHQGSREQIFLDQSTVAETVGGPAGAGSEVPPLPQTAPPSMSLPVANPAPPSPLPGQPVQFQPRNVNGRVNGVVVSPGADSQIFRAAGFAPGDVIVAIDGQPVRSVEQVRAQVAQSRGEVTVMVDRGGRAIPMRVRLSR
ncbi:MAG TPA: type II secretion system protein N [Allosphingosinicella sp.]|nr:type II secretion system protein N [Allosphingosinicella sp.]